MLTPSISIFFFFNDTATTEIYTLSLHDALPIYCVVDLSALYFDVLKDRLYTKARKNKSRRSAQTAVWKIADALVRLAAPVLVFTAEEIWKHLPKTEIGRAHV